MGSIFSPPKPPAPPPVVIPEPEPVTPMADSGDVLAKEKKKQEAASSVARSGRLSTILSDSGGSQKLGG